MILLEPLTPRERGIVAGALLAYERESMAATGQPD